MEQVFWCGNGSAANCKRVRRNRQGVAAVEGGQFKTLPERGTIGGPHEVMVIGADGVPKGGNPYGTPLFPPYYTTVDLPKNDATMDFDVPRSGR